VNGTVQDVDAQRARWWRYRSAQRLTLEAGDEFALGGLARQVDSLDLRLLFLPGDPEADAVPLDSETLGWLKEPRPAPYGGPSPQWGQRDRGTSSALVVYDQFREDRGWERYLALHRHGGIDLAFGGLTYEVSDRKVFPLRHSVGIVWIAAALQSEAAERWRFDLPCELAVALRTTNGAILGGFAEGWAEPGRGLWEFTPCIEDHVLFRWELEDKVDAENVAMALGDRLEQAFGSTHGRHLAYRGDHAGHFDPRFGF
jgi:hypothetical protein